MGWSSCAHIIGGKRQRRCKTRLNATYKSAYSHFWMSLSRRHRRVCSTLLEKLGLYVEGIVENAEIVLEYRESTLAECTRQSRRDGAATRSRVLLLTEHSHLVLFTSQFHAHHNKQQQRAGALTLSSLCLDGGRRLWVARQVRTTSPMAQPQCSNEHNRNVNTIFFFCQVFFSINVFFCQVFFSVFCQVFFFCQIFFFCQVFFVNGFFF